MERPCAPTCPLPPARPQAKYNVMEALVYLGPFTFGALAAGAYAFEWEGLRTQARRAAGHAGPSACQGQALLLVFHAVSL